MKFTSLIKLTVAEEPRVALNEKIVVCAGKFLGIPRKKSDTDRGREMEKYFYVREHYRREEKVKGIKHYIYQIEIDVQRSLSTDKQNAEGKLS